LSTKTFKSKELRLHQQQESSNKNFFHDTAFQHHYTKHAAVLAYEYF